MSDQQPLSDSNVSVDIEGGDNPKPGGPQARRMLREARPQVPLIGAGMLALAGSTGAFLDGPSRRHVLVASLTRGRPPSPVPSVQPRPPRALRPHH